MKKHWKLIAYLMGFLILTVTLAATQPLSDPSGQTNPPDELSRYMIPQYIYEHGTLPTGLEEEIRIPGYGFSYALYNAFPYIVMGLAMRITGNITSDPAALLFAARFVNVLAGLCMAWVVWLLGRRFFAGERSRWLFSLAVTYQPMNLFVHSYVNTDSFCMLSTAVIVYALIRLYQDHASVKTCVLLAAGIILCALSYYSAYGYILAAMILFAAYFAVNRKGFLKYTALTAGIVLIGISWWFIRQGIVLNGDFLGLRTRAELTAAYGHPSILQENTFAGQGYSFFGMLGEMIARRLPAKMAGTLIAAYGSLNIRPALWFYILYAAVWTAGLAGYAAGLIRYAREKRKPGRVRMLFHACMLLCIVLPLILFLHYCYTTDYQEQGRYLLPALVPAMYYFTKGTERLGRGVSCFAGAAILFCAAWQVFAVALPVFL